MDELNRTARAQEIVELNLMSTAEVAAMFNITPRSVPSLMRRYGVRELRGWPRVAVNTVRPKGQGHRSDLEKEGSAGE